MARKEKKSNRWIKTDRVGEVTLFITARSPYWWMYWTEPDRAVSEDGDSDGRRWREYTKSTRETDLSFARLVASKKNEELFKVRHYACAAKPDHRPARIRPVIDDFLKYLKGLNRSHDHIKNLKGRLGYLAGWMEKRSLMFVQDVNPELLRRFMVHLRDDRRIKASTTNDYLDAVHNFFGFVIFKKRLMAGVNPAASGRQAQLDRLPERTLPPPTIYPDQVNAVIEVARRRHDPQLVDVIVFVCEGGFRFQEVQFLQVGDINLEAREILLDIKRPDLSRVRPELQRTCLTPEGLWVPKSRASRRPIHITDLAGQGHRDDGAGRGLGLALREPGRQSDRREQDAPTPQAVRTRGRRPG